LRPRHQLVLLECPHGTGVCPEQRRRLLHDLFEDGSRVQLGGESAARARELLRQRPGRPLCFEEPAPLQRRGRGIAEMASDLEILVRELTLARKEDDDESRTFGARARRRDRKQRAVSHLSCQCLPRLLEAVVARHVRGSEDMTVVGGGPEAVRGLGQPVLERLGQLRR
jgi:hypothetical protein